MTIADLNHLEIVEANVTGGITNKYAKTKLVFDEYVNIDKFVTGKANIKGLIAFAEADAVAEGPNALSNALSSTYTGNNLSISSATSASASNGGHGGYSYGY